MLIFSVARGSYGPFFLIAYAATTASGATFLGLPALAYQWVIISLVYLAFNISWCLYWGNNFYSSCEPCWVIDLEIDLSQNIWVIDISQMA